MNLAQIRNECWALAREVATVDSERLWTTAEMNIYINRVYKVIARETKCIRDSQTATVCQIPVDVRDWTTLTVNDGMDYVWATTPSDSDPSVGKYWLFHQNVSPNVLSLDSRIIQIDECKWTDRQWRLTKVSYTKWSINPWWEQVVGMPTEYATDYSNNKIALNFRSTTADILRLVVRRLPLVDLINDTDEPEFRSNYHDFFRWGVLEQMYSKQDSQTIDATKSMDYGARFKADLDEIKQQESYLDERLRPNFSMAAFR